MSRHQSLLSDSGFGSVLGLGLIFRLFSKSSCGVGQWLKELLQPSDETTQRLMEVLQCLAEFRKSLRDVRQQWNEAVQRQKPPGTFARLTGFFARIHF